MELKNQHQSDRDSKIGADFQLLIKQLRGRFSPQLVAVDNIFYDAFGTDINMIKNILAHISGGKRLRSIIIFSIASIYDGCDNAFHCAAGIEMLHAATLLHDDILDESVTRRGKKTANTIWGTKASLLVGDYLLSQALSQIIQLGNIDCLYEITNAAKNIAESEVLQMSKIGTKYDDIDTYLRIISGKTASLFAAAAFNSAIAAGAQEDSALWRDFGRNLGIAFQITDDLLDYHGDEKNVGKALMQDFFERKITLPLLLLNRKNDKNVAEIVDIVFSENEALSQDIISKSRKIIMEALLKHNIAAETKAYAQRYVDQACRCIDAIEERRGNGVGSHLTALVRALLHRLA